MVSLTFSQKKWLFSKYWRVELNSTSLLAQNCARQNKVESYKLGVRSRVIFGHWRSLVIKKITGKELVEMVKNEKVVNHRNA